MDELMEILTLLQTQKIKKKMAVVVYGTEYWNKVLNLDEMLRYGVITKKDLSLFKFIDSPKEAFQYLKGTLMKNYPPEH
jgi:predicted Rossmann-fold nucleotide-binding protein